MKIPVRKILAVRRGREAEASVAEILKAKKFKILEQNWRTRHCEIDVIAEKAETLFFIEVKYRSTEQAGSGLEYIHKDKLRQMKFAAEYYIAQSGWEGDWRLVGAEVDSYRNVKLVDINF